MVLSRTDRTSIFAQHGRKESSGTVSTKATSSTRSSSMRDLFRRLSNGMQSVVSQEGGFDDLYPSDDVEVFDKTGYDPTEITHNETITTNTYSDLDSIPGDNMVVREVPPSPTSVVGKRKKSNRRGSADTNKSAKSNTKAGNNTRNSPPKRRMAHDTANKPSRRASGDDKPATSSTRRVAMQKARSDRGLRRSPFKQRLPVEQEQDSLQRPRSPLMRKSQSSRGLEGSRRNSSPCKSSRPQNRVDPNDRIMKSPRSRKSNLSVRRPNSPRKERRNDAPLRERTSSSPVKEHRSSSPTKESRSTSPIKEIRIPNTPPISSNTKRTASPSKERRPSSSTKDHRPVSPVKEIFIPSTPTTSSTKNSASPLCKANFVPRIPLSPVRQRQSLSGPSKDAVYMSPKSETPRPQRFDKRKCSRHSDTNLSSFMDKCSQSDSRLSFAPDLTSVGVSTQASKRRQSSRHPKRHTEVLDPKRRVVPQRSRSLTDLRDMLRPKSDPRHKSRRPSLDQKSKSHHSSVNPLDQYFSSQVTVAPPPKDSVTVTGSTTLTPSARRPLERRLERHRMLSSSKLQCNDDNDFDAAPVSPSRRAATASSAPVSPSKATLPEQLASLRDMTKEDWALHLASPPLA